MERGKAAHRDADDMRLGNAEPVEHGADVVAGAILRIALRVLRHIRGRITAGVVGDAAVTAREIADLRLEAATVVGKLVDKDNRGARPGFLVIEPDAVIGGDVWHCRSSQQPICWRGSPGLRPPGSPVKALGLEVARRAAEAQIQTVSIGGVAW